MKEQGLLTFIEQSGQYNLNTEAVRFHALDGNKHPVVFAVSREALEDLEQRSNCDEAELVDIYTRNIHLIRKTAKQIYRNSPGGFDPYIITSMDLTDDNSSDFSLHQSQPYNGDVSASMDDILQDYDDLTDDVLNSRYESFSMNLRLWFNFIGTNLVLNSIVEKLTAGQDFQNWILQAQTTASGMVGSGNLNWPGEKEDRLGMKLRLFRSFSEGDYTVENFCLTFLYAEGGFPEMVEELNSQYFRPLSRDLRKIIRAQLDNIGKNQRSVEQVPASDRIVTLNHNSPIYIDAIEALNNCRDEYARSKFSDNDPYFKERTLAQLDSGKLMLGKRTVVAEVFYQVCVSALSNLVSKFVSTNLSAIAQRAIDLFQKLMGP